MLSAVAIKKVSAMIKLNPLYLDETAEKAKTRKGPSPGYFKRRKKRNRKGGEGRERGRKRGGGGGRGREGSKEGERGEGRGRRKKRLF